MCGVFLTLAAVIAVTSCAAKRKEAQTPMIVYRVALINSGAYKTFYDQALVELGAYREINLSTGKELKRLLEPFGLRPENLVRAKSFADVANVEGLDFALVLLPAPIAYPSGSVGLKSINWHKKSVRTVPAVEVPRFPFDWLVSANNGWTVITSYPPGAHISVGGSLAGVAPLLLMPDEDVIDIQAQWSRKVKVTKKVDVSEGDQTTMRAPEDYVTKSDKRTFYKRLQDADEKHGSKFFIALYVLIVLAGLAGLFYAP